MSISNSIRIAEKLQRTTYVLEVYEDNKAADALDSYSTGSAVSINDTGTLLTAAHVILGTNGSDPSKMTGQEIIQGRTAGKTQWIQYIPKLLGIQIHMKDVFRKPLFLDLAILQPAIHLSGIEFISPSKRISPTGTMVLMAGFPDEIDPPLSFHRFLDFSNPIFANPEHKTPRKVKDMKHQLLLKSGMIGYANSSHFSGCNGSPDVSFEAYYVDNGMNPGASGGPIVDLNGELVGIITQRAVTEVNHLELQDPRIHVPSGSTVGISPRALADYLK